MIDSSVKSYFYRKISENALGVITHARECHILEIMCQAGVNHGVNC